MSLVSPPPAGSTVEDFGDAFCFLRCAAVAPPQLDPVMQPAVEQVIRALGQVAGIQKRVYPHLLRHSFANDYLRPGGNPIQLQILGHGSLAMVTQTYQHLTFTDAHEELMRVLAMDMR
jgi:site-specific recombinase XerD